jgi:hypothetical protein
MESSLLPRPACQEVICMNRGETDACKAGIMIPPDFEGGDGEMGREDLVWKRGSGLEESTLTTLDRWSARQRIG